MIGDVWFFGGFTGSELYTAAAPQQWIWPNFQNLALGREGKMRLDSDRHSPGPPDGVEMVSLGIVTSYYANCLQSLFTQLGSLQITFRTVPYDWRLSYLDSGEVIATKVLERYRQTGKPLTLIAHSFGGLMLRGVWYALVQANMTSAVRRIITIGTAHQGCMASVAFLTQGAPEYNGFLSLTRLADAASDFRLVSDSRSWTIQDLQILFLSFPSMLELLPVLGAPLWADDPTIPDLYQPGTWPDAFDMNRTPLQWVRNISHPLLSQSGTIPPYEVLTTVGGRGWDTPFRRADSGQLSPSSQFDIALSGDLFVERASALMPDSKQYVLLNTHGDLPNVLGTSGQLLDMILDERSPLPPPYPSNPLPSSPLAIAGPYPYQPQQFPGYQAGPAGRRGGTSGAGPATPIDLVIDT